MGLPSIDLNLFPEMRPQPDVESLVMDLFEQEFRQAPLGSVGGEFQPSPLVETSWEGEPNNSVSRLAVTDGRLKVRVFNEIDVDVDAYAQASDVVVFHCEPPVFAGRRHQSHMWECSMSLLVESVDADRAFRLASYVRQLVMCWPRFAPTKWGQVAKITTPPAFAKAAGGKQATSKRIKQYATATTCEFHVRDPFS